MNKDNTLYVVSQHIGENVTATKITEARLKELLKKHNVKNIDELWEKEEIAISTFKQLKEDYKDLNEIDFDEDELYEVNDLKELKKLLKEGNLYISIIDDQNGGQILLPKKNLKFYWRLLNREYSCDWIEWEENLSKEERKKREHKTFSDGEKGIQKLLKDLKNGEESSKHYDLFPYGFVKINTKEEINEWENLEISFKKKNENEEFWKWIEGDK